MSKLILILITVLFLSGCDLDNKTPSGLNSSARPLTVIAINSEGVILSDGDGKIYTYNEGFYFADILIEQGVKAGDVIGGILKIKGELK